jgi:FdhD protein
VTRSPGGEVRDDIVAVEEPLEIRVDREPLAVLMRTPGDERALIAGFLLTEGVIDGPDDLAALAPCRDPDGAPTANVWQVRLASGGGERLARAQRAFFASSSCGLCGKASIDRIVQQVHPHAAAVVLPRGLVATVGARAREHQAAFGATGGLHAAALFSLDEPDQPLLGAAEDVGRHNAIDKVLGAQLLADALPVAPAALWVSGRASFEVVQKALLGGVAALVCVGAPTSLAVSLAAQTRLTLVGFARGGDRFNVYVGAVTDEGGVATAGVPPGGGT